MLRGKQSHMPNFSLLDPEGAAGIPQIHYSFSLVISSLLRFVWNLVHIKSMVYVWK